MKLLWLVPFCVPLWGLSNAVMVSTSSLGASGGTLALRAPIPRRLAGEVFSIPRYFANNEVCGYAQPYVGGLPITHWQSDVKNRWPADANCAAGYVKFALITVEQALSSGPIAIEFRSASAASSGGTGLTQQQMLDFTTVGGRWGASLAAGTGGMSYTVSARTMLSNGQYQVLESGPLRTSILVREGPDAVNSSTTRNTSFGFGCTANCVAPYDQAQWTNSPSYNSMRPSFVVTFYTSPGGGISGSQVEVDYVLDNSWMDRAQDQRIESFVLNQGTGENTPCYTAPAAFVVPFRSRVFETCWTPVAPSIQIDFNRAYVTYSKAAPAYGLNYTIGESAIELELVTFNASDQGSTTTTAIAPEMGWGEFIDQGAAAAGGAPELGWTNRWTARYLTSFDPRLLNVVLSNAKAFMHNAIWYLENNTSAAYIAGSTTPAFGRVVSLDVRPSFNSYIGDGTNTSDSPKSPAGQIVIGPGFTNTPCIAPACMVTCVSKSSATLNWCSVYGPNTVNNWGEDVAHSTEAFYVAYLFTGKRVYAEAQWALGAWELTSEANGSPPPRYGRWDTKGLIYEAGNTSRSTAWALRNLGAAALASPDGSPEQTYFVTKLNYNLESNEGRFNITNGVFPPSDPSCGSFNINTETSVWRMSRCWYEQGWSNPLGFFMEHDPGLGQTCTGCNGSLAADGLSPWMDEYAVLVFSWLTDVGFPAQYSHQVIAAHTVHLIADSDFAEAPFDIVRYRLPNVTVGYAGYLQTYAAMKAAYITSATLAANMSATDTNFYIASLTGSGSQPGNLNNLDGTSLPYTYWQIDSEIIELYQAYWQYTLVTAVNSTTNQATAPGHGLTTGQIVRVEGAPIDAGMVGNPLCKAPGILPNTPNNDCDFWVKAVDANTVELYNDAALTNPVPLMGGGVNLSLNVSRMVVLTNGRGTLKSAAAAHQAGAIMYRVPAIMSKTLTGDPTGSHAYIHLSGVATAADANVSTPDEGSGQILTGLNAFNALDQAVPSQNLLGGNTPNCAAAGLTVNSCDNPQWAIRPRPQIRAVTATPTANSVQMSYTAPDSNTCTIGISQTLFASSDSSTDTPDSGGQNLRVFSQANLSSNTSYFYRITCGPGGAARVIGTFQTLTAGTVYQANPSNYQAILGQLQSCETIALASGTYPQLALSGLNGTPTAWITVIGPASGPPAIIAGAACCNTVEITNSSYLAIENLTIDSQSIDGAFGISAYGTNNITHDILIQNNILIGQDASQQTDGISTKIPTWNWTIRNNTITGAGTGLYLGNSDGTDPFIAGLIENNLIQNTIGYNMEIKYQIARPTVPGMPTGTSTTIVCNNVFIKNDQASPDGDRPNVLLGGFPATGAGSSDMYQVYGNFFYYNPREALLQAEGQVSIHDNIFVDGQYAAIGLFQTDAPLNSAYVYNNTIYTAAQGIFFGNAAAVTDGVTGNLVFAATPISGPIANLSNNIVDTLANAASYVNAPSFTLGAMNFYPLPGQAQGPALNLSAFATDTDYSIDFNGTAKNALLGATVFRGAYAGQETNPGWQLQATIKPLSTLPGGSSDLQSLQCTPSTLSPGQISTCLAVLSAPALSVSTVSLQSSSTAVTVPATVSIAANAVSATFPASGVSAGPATIMATLNGAIQTSVVTVIPLPIVTNLTCSPATLGPGSSTNCTVTVSPSPGTPATVVISSSSAAITAPASVAIAAGATTTVFAATVGATAAAQNVTLTASLNGGSAEMVLTVQSSGGTGTGPASFYLRGTNSEFSGLSNGAIVTPTTAPTGLTGAVVVRGTGSVSLSPVINGDGVAFAGVSQGNTDTAFLSFPGPQVGSLFNVNQGDLTLYVKSSYSFAQRQALPMQNYRYVFDVYDSTGELFRFFISTSGGRLIVQYATGSRTSGAYYYVPVGQEDAMFGLGVVAKFRVTWNGGTNVLYWNDAQVATFAYAAATPNWGASSSFVIGGTAVPAYGGGYYKCDDAIADFQMNGN